ncbi:hypothetical protein TNCT_312471, partial [Trichonephila clavata]
GVSDYVRTEQKGPCHLVTWKRNTVTPPMSPQLDAKAQATIARREKVLKVGGVRRGVCKRYAVCCQQLHQRNGQKSMPKDLRDSKDVLFTNLRLFQNSTTSRMLNSFKPLLNP